MSAVSEVRNLLEVLDDGTRVFSHDYKFTPIFSDEADFLRWLAQILIQAKGVEQAGVIEGPESPTLTILLEDDTAFDIKLERH